MSTGQLDDAAFTQELRKLPYDKRWDLLKPKLESLFYTTEVDHICRLLKDRWAFEATPRQCKYRFKSWGWKKSIPEKVKQELSVKALKRAAKGKDTIALYHGRLVPPQRLHRTLNTVTNRQPSMTTMLSLPAIHFASLEGYLPFGDRLLVNWKMPYGTKRDGPALVWSYGSPLSPIQSPSSVDAQTPEAMGKYSPDIMTSSRNEASLSSVVRQQRFQMLLEGRWHDLLPTLSQTEQTILSTWLHQFFNFAFITAQSWDRTPDPIDQSLATLGSVNDDSIRTSTPRAHPPSAEIPLPTQQCRWTIHEYFDYHGNDDDDSDIMNPSLEDCLLQSLRSNNFTDIPEDQLPLPIPEIMRQIRPNSNELVLESVASAIMGRNDALLIESLQLAERRKIDVASLYPFHMAAAFLDGATACCSAFDILSNQEIGSARSKDRLTNEYGHTVLDALLLTILRSHTTIAMKDADGTLGDNAKFPGQEVDICGRWSVESPCYQALIASGSTTLPVSWKHKFCHTSVQAVLHSATILLCEIPTLRDLPSGLFTHQCFNCGRRLQLGPLHAVVMLAFTLATSGLIDEDLFGVVAYYLLLVTTYIATEKPYDICVAQLLGTNFETGCNHEKMTPHEMTVAMDSHVKQLNLTEAARTGWGLFIITVQLAEGLSMEGADPSQEPYNEFDSAMPDSQDPDATASVADDMEGTDNHRGYNTLLDSSFLRSCDDKCHVYGDKYDHFGDSPLLGHIWAAITAELVNYRKLNENDGWLSESFSMRSLLASLVHGNSPDIGYIKCDMLKPYCSCGNFKRSTNPMGFVSREEVFKEDSSNMVGSAEACARTSFTYWPYFTYP